MATLDRGISSPAANGLLKELAEARSDLNFYRRRLVAANGVIEALREMARLESVPIAVRDALEEYDALPVEPQES